MNSKFSRKIGLSRPTKLKKIIEREDRPKIQVFFKDLLKAKNGLGKSKNTEISPLKSLRTLETNEAQIIKDQKI